MQDVKIFNFNDYQIRNLMIDNEPWFVGKDVADVLGYNEPHKAIARHVDEGDGMKRPILTNGGMQEMTIINESGLYSLILSSKLPQAKEFKHWVTSVVLPSIRQTGSYGNNLSFENKIKIAELITKCKNNKAIESIMALFRFNAIEYKQTANDSVNAFVSGLNDNYLFERSTHEIHDQYKIFCIDNNYKYLSLMNFSKEIHNLTGATVRRHRVSGRLTGFYVLGVQ